ncbi:ComEC/Rec2 family competence protein [Rhodococcus sp. X156]|uniref:ComEC/Rec2 family competence protein n=1 Tax=Rhodococcus sp. X156 TaxID=2499145 RepID=UPI000FDB4802|nr:ComEC/Rec2 family competence protein [Rhodococcus sp. X156]
MSTSAAPAERLDVRLLPSAGCAWAAVLLGLLAGWQVSVVVAALALGGIAWVRRRSRRAVAAGLLAALAVTAGFSAATALRTHAVDVHPLAAAAERGESAQLQVRLSDDPKLLRAALPGAPQRVLVRAQLTSAEGYPEMHGAVVLLAPADSWAHLLPGQQVRVSGRLAPPQRNDLTVGAVRVSDPPELVGQPPRVQRVAGALRTQLRDAAARVLPAEPGALLPGLVVGDTSRLPQPLLDDFRTAGLTHLTAVSGTNITIVCGAVLLLTGLVGASPRTRAVLAAVALVAFVVLARPSPSVLRAAVMGAIALLALVTGRRKRALPALAGAVLVLLLVSPQLAVDAGFTLSVLATGGLVLLAPGWVDGMRRRGVPAGVAELLAVPMAAQAVTAPVIAGLSAQLSVVSVLANILAAPAVGVATVLGVLATVLLPIWTPAGELAVRFAGPAVWWLVQVAHRCAALPSAAVAVPGGTTGALGMAAATVVLLVLARSQAVRVVLLAAVTGAVLVWVPTRVLHPGWPVPGWAMVMCDVGQGDALALATGEGQAVVVDAGPEARAVAGCLDRLGVQQVPLVVLTHLHADHVDGLDGVLAGRSVGAVALGPLHLPTGTLREVQQVADRHGVPVVQLSAGQSLQWGTALTLDVLGPVRRVPGALGGDEGTELNDYSVVLSARTAAGRVLLTGDVEESGQSALLHSGADLRADVLKVPHHGSRFSVPEFLDAVHPRLAVVSVGTGNTYGHPNAGVLDHLARQGATTVRTDQRGDIALLPGPALVTR